MFSSNFNRALLKILALQKNLTAYFNSEQKVLLGLRPLVPVTKHKNCFVIQLNR